MRSIEFRTVDVFTSQRFGGNPLAVVADARGLSTAEMQAIAREFNYSESTFVLPPADPANTAQVRIFTPVQEIPFAGHPNVGTAFVLAELAAARGEAPAGFRFEEGAGLVEVELPGDGVARIRAPRAFTREGEVAPSDVAACLTVSPSDIVTANHPPLIGSVGLPFVFAEVASLEALGRVNTNTAAFEAAHDRYRSEELRFSIFAYARRGPGPEQVQARMSPLTGVPEDPATGSACGALGGLMASLESSPDAVLTVTIDQGVEMGRPSRIEVTAARAGGEVTDVRIAGRSVAVMEGTLRL